MAPPAARPPPRARLEIRVGVGLKEFKPAVFLMYHNLELNKGGTAVEKMAPADEGGTLLTIRLPLSDAVRLCKAYSTVRKYTHNGKMLAPLPTKNQQPERLRMDSTRLPNDHCHPTNGGLAEQREREEEW
jgi:hypothetical protein